MSPIQIIIPGTLSLAAVVLCFFRRLPACLVAYIAYICAGWLGVVDISVDQYLIWGFIAVADTVNIYATRMEAPRAMHLYTVVGCFVGCILGAVFGNLVAIMIAGAVGAILGFIAFKRTPAGRGISSPASHWLSLLAGTACTAWFSFILVATIVVGMVATAHQPA